MKVDNDNLTVTITHPALKVCSLFVIRGNYLNIPRFLKYLAFRSDAVYPVIGYSKEMLLNRFYLNSLGHRRHVSNWYLFLT